MSANAFMERTIDVQGVRSLSWDGGCLVDWASGGHRYFMDGSTKERRVSYAYEFDASIISPSGEYAVIFTLTGTKGVVLRNGEILRQVNRDFYHAHVYAYPIAFAQLPDGREVLIHCPEHYCQLEIEDAETGESLTKVSGRESPDIFHSRLSVSPDGRYLISAGWVWHPLDVVCIFDLPEAVRDPVTLDQTGIAPPGKWELSAAAFVDGDTVVVGTSDEFYGDDNGQDEKQPGENHIAVWTIGESAYSASVALDHPPGTLMAIDRRFVVSFFQHPRLIDLETGETIQEWSDIDCGEQRSSIIWDQHPPPIAMDAQAARFAIGEEKAIRIVQIDVEALRG